MQHPCYKLHLSGQICPLLSAINISSLIPCCSNYYNRFCRQIYPLFHIFLFGMQASDYIQIGNNQMFWLSVFAARYLDIFCNYMPLTSAVATFLNPDFLYIFLAFLLIHFLHYRQNIRLSKRYVISKNASANNSDIFSFYGMSYNFFFRFTILLTDIVGSVSIR